MEVWILFSRGENNILQTSAYFHQVKIKFISLHHHVISYVSSDFSLLFMLWDSHFLCWKLLWLTMQSCGRGCELLTVWRWVNTCYHICDWVVFYALEDCGYCSTQIQETGKHTKHNSNTAYCHNHTENGHYFLCVAESLCKGMIVDTVLNGVVTIEGKNVHSITTCEYSDRTKNIEILKSIHFVYT